MSILLGAIPCSLIAEIYDYAPPSRSGTNYQSAAFRCWIPDGTKTISGVLVIIPSQNADGRTYTEESDYQNICQKWNFALVGCHFTGDEKHFYSEARRGSGRALQNALRDFSDKSGQRELFNAPMALIGFSAGAQFSFSMTCYKSSDVIAFVSDKGVYYTSRPDGGTYDTPGLFIVGENDKDTPSQANTEKLFQRGKARRALWALSVEEDAKHKAADGNARELILDYLDAAIKTRINLERKGDRPKKVRADVGVFLNHVTGEITSRDNRKAEEGGEWSWLPSEKLAQKFLDDKALSPTKD